jgi:hypothetical protein
MTSEDVNSFSCGAPVVNPAIRFIPWIDRIGVDEAIVPSRQYANG